MLAVRTLIVDDHQLVREGIQLMLSGDTQIKVVSEAINGREAVADV